MYLASILNKYKMHAVNKRVKYYFIYYYFAVPDDMVMKVLSGRLSQLDCATRGWVLHGFPLTREQAELLDEHGYEPYRWGRGGMEGEEGEEGGREEESETNKQKRDIREYVHVGETGEIKRHYLKHNVANSIIIIWCKEHWLFL